MSVERHTAAGMIVFRREPDGCRFLLLLSRQTKRPLWEFPKGGVQEGETLLQAALRELEEETGLARTAIRLVDGFERTEEYRFRVQRDSQGVLIRKQVTYFLARALHDRVRPAAQEATRHTWVGWQEASRRLRYPARRRILEDARAAAGCADG